MFFDTPLYLAFLAVVVILYWQLNRRNQNVLLLAASYFFYGCWDWRFLSLICISTVVDFFSARYIARSANLLHRRALLTFSLVLNFGFLGVFKYFNFFAGSFTSFMGALGVSPPSIALLRILLPPGISFYTFQAVAYIVDVYYGKLEPAGDIFDYGLFISLFPHLVAGPIQRPDHLLPQVQRERTFEPGPFFDGLLLILTGLFRKCVVADSCALLADAAFDGRLGPGSLGTVLIGVYAFAWQIYADFSGYSDIARGSAQLMGFHFMVNFRQPYLAESLQDFWRRWHISLSTWLRDYLYIPLGGNRRGEARTYQNLMTTMLLGGLWHGANWTYVIWGALHGAGLSIERFFFRGRDSREQDSGGIPVRSAVSIWGRRIFIFHVVCLAWIFFRAQSLSASISFLGGLAVPALGPHFFQSLTFLAAFTVPLFMLDLALEYRSEEYLFERLPALPRVATAAALTSVLLIFSANSSAAFIYFQF